MFFIRHYEHPSTTFRELDSTQVTLNKKIHPAFTTKKDSEITRVFHYTYEMSIQMFENMMTQVSDPSIYTARGICFFTINNNELIQKLKQDFINQVPGSAAAPSDGSCGGEEVALDISSIEKVSRIFSSYFHKSQHLFSVSDNEESHLSYIRDTSTDLFQEACDCLKLKKTEIPSSFSKETLEEFKVRKGIRLRDPRKMPCYSFAYMLAKEKRAASIIFEESVSNEPMANIFAQLKEWKYQSVDWPIAGDLVVYLKDKVATHVGVYQESGRVLSKMGIRQPTCREHEIFDVPREIYGCQAIFFRKASGTV